MKGKKRYILLGLVVLFAIFVFLNNTNLFLTQPGQALTLLAHRGIAQDFDRTDLRNDTCTAARMLPPTHSYLENTIPSMAASFEAGADIVELDVHPTMDGEFAVFHDWTLDCRTEGSGATRDHAMEELRQLDVGYGYTADGGKTFPFRGKGVGLMPSLRDVLKTFPDRRFLINIKSNDPEEGELLARFLNTLSDERRAGLLVYGGDRPVAIVRSGVADVKTMSRETLKACLMRYVGYSWTGIVPHACRDMMLFVPINIAPWLWGWPHRFLDRMAGVGSQVFVIGPYSGGGFFTGIDTKNDLMRLPEDYAGGIMTNDIEGVARAIETRSTPKSVDPGR